jgi:type I restriction enzyme S subunit
MTATAVLDGQVAKIQLPDGWRLAKLGEVCDIIAGQSPPGETYRKSPEGLPFFQGKADFGFRHPVARTWCVAPNKIALVGDILISVRAPVGPTNVADVECCIGRGLAAIRPRAKYADRDFILSALQLYESDLVKLGSGSTFQAIDREDLETLGIPLPPLAEQKRIAGILQEQMAAVDRARASAKAQLQAVKNLPAAHLRAVFSSPEAQGWQKKKLGDIFKVKSGEGLTAKAMTQGGMYPVYGGNGINGYHDSYLFEESKIVIGRVGAYCGCIHTTEPKSWITDNALYVSEKFDEFKDEFMVHALRFLDLNTKANSMAQPLVTGQLIYPLEIGIPPLDEQPRLASQLSAQMSSAERLRQTLTEQLDAINQLPAALLRRAFNGEI